MQTPPEGDLSRYYVWFDTEFTSLDMGRSRLMQVGMVVTDHRLQRVGGLDRDLNLCIRLDIGDSCDPWVEANLAPLVARCHSDEAVTVENADEQLVLALGDLLGPCPEDITRRPVVAGNSIQADWYLAGKYLPRFKAWLNYRVLDVSSWKVHLRNCREDMVIDKADPAVVRQWFPGEFNSTAKDHDAHYDVLASIAELAYYNTRLGLTETD